MVINLLKDNDMKKVYNILLALVTVFAVSACGEDTDPIYDETNATASTLQTIAGNYVLSMESADFATFTYSAANFGMDVSVVYSLETSMDESFSQASELGSSTGDTSIEVAADKMNSTLMNWDVAPGTPTTVYFRIKSYVQNLSSRPTDMVLYSNVISSIITPYSSDKEYPKVWVIGDYCGWSFDTTQYLFCFEEDDVNYQGMVDFGEKAANGFKITGVAGWDDTCNWGTDGNAAAPSAEASSIVLISAAGSGNIACYSNRFYHFSFDKTTLTLKKGDSFNMLSIVGDASGSWDNDIDMEFDTAKQRFWTDVDFSDGEFKFRVDHDWAVSYGSKTEGLLDSGDNIKVSAGKYRVYVNMNNAGNLTYELSAKDYGK